MNSKSHQIHTILPVNKRKPLKFQRFHGANEGNRNMSVDIVKYIVVC